MVKPWRNPDVKGMFAWENFDQMRSAAGAILAVAL